MLRSFAESVGVNLVPVFMGPFEVLVMGLLAVPLMRAVESLHLLLVPSFLQVIVLMIPVLVLVEMLPLLLVLLPVAAETCGFLRLLRFTYMVPVIAELCLI